MAQWSTAVLRLIQKLNNFLRPGSSKLSCQPFLVDGVQVGYISPQISSYLSSYSDVFCMVKSNDGEIVQMTLNPKIKTFLERTEKVAEVMMELRQKDAFSTLRGWRDEVLKINIVCTILSSIYGKAKQLGVRRAVNKSWIGFRLLVQNCYFEKKLSF